eukprot:scpid106469/ scgid0976/ 
MVTSGLCRAFIQHLKSFSSRSFPKQMVKIRVQQVCLSITNQRGTSPRVHTRKVYTISWLTLRHKHVHCKRRGLVDDLKCYIVRVRIFGWCRIKRTRCPIPQACTPPHSLGYVLGYSEYSHQAAKFRAGPLPCKEKRLHNGLMVGLKGIF